MPLHSGKNTPHLFTDYFNALADRPFVLRVSYAYTLVHMPCVHRSAEIPVSEEKVFTESDFVDGMLTLRAGKKRYHRLKLETSVLK